MKNSKEKTIFGHRLEKLMDERGINGIELADLLGKERKSVYKMKYSEDGPKLRALVIMAHYFGVSIDYLAGRTDIRAPIDKFLDRKPAKKPDDQKFFNKNWEG